MAGIDIVHVPYRGGALAAADVIGGQVQMMIDVMPNAYPLAKSGRLRGLACTTGQRFPAAPEYPTIAESGLPGFAVSAWDGLFAPAGTPAGIVVRLNDADPAGARRPAGARIAAGARRAGRARDAGRSRPPRRAQEAEKWAKVVRQSGAKID